MKILALNCGSSSVKFQLFETGPERIRDGADRVMARGSVERIAHSPATVKFQATGGPVRKAEAEIADHQEAIEEARLDLEEGADMIMVKPALPYLDIISRVRDAFHCPVAAYCVSGEYSMIKAASLRG